jgi:hypothetical protein
MAQLFLPADCPKGLRSASRFIAAIIHRPWEKSIGKLLNYDVLNAHKNMAWLSAFNCYYENKKMRQVLSRRIFIISKQT